MPSPVKWRARPILRRLPAEGPIRGCEVGVFKGVLSRYLLTMRPDLTLIMVDPWMVPDAAGDYAKSQDGYGRRMAHNPEKIYRIAMQLTDDAKDRRIVMRETSEEAAKKIEAKSLDFVFIDGDHSFHQVRWDLYWWFCKIKTDGWLCGHDRARPGVSRALEAFVAESGLSVEQDTGGTWHIRMARP